MKPGKIAQDIEDSLRRERRRKARAKRLKKIVEEHKKKEGVSNEYRGNNKEITDCNNAK